MLVDDLVQKEACPIRPVDLGKLYWAKKMLKNGVINSCSSASMQDAIDVLCEIYEPFYSDGDGRLCLAKAGE